MPDSSQLLYAAAHLRRRAARFRKASVSMFTRLRGLAGRQDAIDWRRRSAEDEALAELLTVIARLRPEDEAWLEGDVLMMHDAAGAVAALFGPKDGVTE